MTFPACVMFVSLFPLQLGDIEDSLGEGLRRFLRQVVPDATRDEPVHVFACELVRIGAGFRMWRAVGIAFQSNRGHFYDRAFGKPLLEIIVSWLTSSETEPPSIVVDHDRNM